MIGLAISFPVPLFADTLAGGSVYFDSEQTYAEVKRLAANGDNEGISKLIADGHVSRPVPDDVDISVVTPELSPEGLVEFRFHNGATSFWSPAKWVKSSSPGLPGSEPTAASSPLQAAQDLPDATPSSGTLPSHPYRAGHHNKRRMHHYWHMVNGHLYWSPVPLKRSDETSGESQ